MSERKEQMEKVLDFFHDEKYKFEADFTSPEGERVVVLRKYDIRVTLTQEAKGISFDIYADLNGVYEFGDMHVLLTAMLRAKDHCMKLNLRERNTTERLYPPDRRGKNTETSGL